MSFLNTETIAEHTGQKACEYLQEKNVEAQYNVVFKHHKFFKIRSYTIYVNIQHGGITQTISKRIKPWSRNSRNVCKIYWNTHSSDRKLSDIASILTKN